MNKRQEPRLRFKGFTGAWEEKRLSDVVEIIGGGTPDTNNSAYWGGEIDWYSPTEIGENVYANGSIRKITPLGLQKSSAVILPANRTVLFTSRASIGDMAILTKQGATNQGFQSFIVREELDIYFLYSIGFKIREYALKNASGSTFLEISKTQLLQMESLFPSLPEQTHLGLFFRRLDSQIAESRAVLEKSRQLKKAMLAKMFPANGEKMPKIRFKGFEGEWERKSLRDVLEIEQKGKAQYQKLQAGNIPYLDAEFLNGGVKILTDSVSDVDVDDILIIWDGSNAGKVYTGFNGVLGSTLKSYRTNADCLSMFLYQELARNEEVIFSQYRTPNIPHVIKNFSDEYNFLMPSYKEQTAIGNFFRQLDENIALQSAEVEKLNQLKKGLLAVMLV